MAELGLIANIFTNEAYTECSMGGVSSRCKSVTIIGMGNGSEIFEPNPERPAVRLVFRTYGNREKWVHAEPVEKSEGKTGGFMFGGAYISTSDSRLGEVLLDNGIQRGMAIPLHDRQES